MIVSGKKEIFFGRTIFKKKPKIKLQKIELTLLLIFVLLSSFLFSEIAISLSRPHIYFLDVGQGDCIVITDGEYCVVIDGGGLQGKQYGENTGTTILIPFLLKKQIRKVDFLVVTHMHYDHLAGAVELLGNFKVEHLILSGVWKDRHDQQLQDDLLEAAIGNNVKVMYAFEHFSICTKNVTLECLFPFQSSEFSDNENNNSSVFLMTSGPFKALFTGDIESNVEEELIEQGKVQSDINVLKVAHHGSKTSSSVSFLQQVTPDCTIISVGANLFGHPSKEVLNTFVQLEIPMFLTQNCGMIEIEILDNKYTLRSYKGENK